jgi:CrcB protein
MLGGAVGAGARYGVGLALRQVPTFPWSTLAVNVVGSFMIGIVLVLADEEQRMGASLRTFLAVGVLGGFTTFSSFSAETLRLWEQGRVLLTILNVMGSVGLCLVAVAGGVALARSLR